MKKTALTFAAALAALALLGSCKVVETETETEYVDKIVEVEKSDKTPSAAVTAVKAIAGNGKVMLSWQESADADFYGVRISGSLAAGTLKSPVVVQKGVTSLSAAELVNGTAYTFTLTALDTALNESGPATVKATPVDAADTTPLADVTALTATNKGGSVLLTWTDNNADSDLFGYEVSYRRAESTDAETVVATVAQGTQRCYVDGLINGTKYTFTVRSVDTSGNHSAGATATCTLAPLALSIALTVPSDPADVPPPIRAEVQHARGYRIALRLCLVQQLRSVGRAVVADDAQAHVGVGHGLVLEAEQAQPDGIALPVFGNVALQPVQRAVVSLVLRERLRVL